MSNVRMRMFAVAALVPGLLAVAAPASAATPSFSATADTGVASVQLLSATISKTQLVLSADDSCGVEAKVTAVLNAPLPTENVLFSGVGADLETGRGGYYDSLLLENTSGNTWTGDLVLCGDTHPAGSYRMSVSAMYVTGTGMEDMQVFQSNIKTLFFDVKRASKLTYNASPEPVRKGASLTGKGKLTADGKAVRNAVVKIYFKADGAADYTYKGSATTDAKGNYSKRFKASKTGMWKAVYAGSSSRTSVVKYDAVKVKK